MANDIDLDKHLRALMRTRYVPPFEPIWHQAQPVMVATPQSPQRFTHHVRVALALVILLVLTTNVVLASSSEIRQRLLATVRIGGGGSSITVLQPPPMFAIFQPSYLPAGIRLVASAYNPGSTDNGSVARVVTGSILLDANSNIPESAIAMATQRGEALVQGGTPTVVFIYTDDKMHIVEIVQEPGSINTLPQGDSVTLHGTPGVITNQSGPTTVTWIEQGTRIQVKALLGRDELIHIANGLQRSTLATMQPDRSTSSVTAGEGFSLAERVVIARYAPPVEHQAIVQECGMWDSNLYKTTPTASFSQAVCVARVVAGEGKLKSSGVDRYRWQYAAARLGLDSTRGPSDNPEVYLVQVSGTDYGDNVVVVNAMTGEPFLIVHLKPS